MTPEPVMNNADLTARVARIEERIASLNELMDAKFVTHRTLLDAAAAQVALALASAEKAIQKAEVATEKRFDSVNEFRSQLADQAQTFVTREAFDAFAIQSQKDRTDLRLHQSDFVTRELLEASKTAAFLKAGDLERRMEDLRNQQTRIAALAVGVASAISIISTLVAVVFRLSTGG